MKKKHGQLYLLLGLWFSLVSVVVAFGTLLPTNTTRAKDSSALLLRAMQNEELAHPNNASSSEKLIVADLSRMQLALYEGNTLIQSLPILSRGEEGTFWETPTGKYVVQAKESKHFSSALGIWMPESIQFYGNFFIHGTPKQAGGGDASGGCIQLSTLDARLAYAFADIGTRVSVIGSVSKDGFATSSRYYLYGGGKPPEISAPSFIVADLQSGSILWERNADAPESLGALVALPVALAAIETLDQYHVVRMGELLLGKSVLRKYLLKNAADELPLGALIYPLLFDTNDTAAKVFAREYGSKKFVAFMNQKAEAIRMTQTKFAGALSSDGSTTTARDLLLFLSYVDKEEHFLIDATLAPLRIFVSDVEDKWYRWENKNPWILGRDARYRGGIAEEHSDGSGSAMVLFTLPVSEFNDRTIAFVLFDSRNLRDDVLRLQHFILTHYMYGMKRDIEEEFDSSLPLHGKVNTLMDVGKFLQDELSYERDVS